MDEIIEKYLSKYRGYKTIFVVYINGECVECFECIDKALKRRDAEKEKTPQKRIEAKMCCFQHEKSSWKIQSSTLII